MTAFFFDENLSQRLAGCIGALDQDVRHVWNTFGRGTADEVWIPHVARQSWVLVTGDKKIRRKSHQRRVLEDAKLISFFVDKRVFDALASPFKQAAWLLHRWDSVVAAAERARPGDHFALRSRGNPQVEPLPRLGSRG